MNISKKELSLKARYNWHYGLLDLSPTLFFGDHLIFGRHDGQQVIFIINKILAQMGPAFQQPKKIEEMLIFMPEKQFTHIQAKAWLIRNWNNKMTLR